MKIETLRSITAACLIVVSATFCVLGSLKIRSDREIADSTTRIAEALEKK